MGLGTSTFDVLGIISSINFSKQYKGHFILRVVIFKGYNDMEEQLPELKKIVDQIDYDELSVGTRPIGKMGDRGPSPVSCSGLSTNYFCQRLKLSLFASLVLGGYNNANNRKSKQTQRNLIKIYIKRRRT